MMSAGDRERIWGIVDMSDTDETRMFAWDQGVMPEHGYQN